MCCCNNPTINGQDGYSWDGKSFGVYPPNPPALNGDTLLYDEPGRCGGIDSHSHHYRVVKSGPWILLRVKHGGGEETIRLHFYKQQVEVLARLDSNDRYWLLNAMFWAHWDAREKTRGDETAKWTKAAAEKRIKTRKLPGQGRVKVWIETAQ